MVSCGLVLVTVASIVSIITLAILGISFGTDHWLEFKVDSSGVDTTVLNDLTKGRVLYTRYRGIFKECYPGIETTAYLQQAKDVVDDYCFETNFDVPEEFQNSKTYSSDYYSRIHLLRCHVAFFAFAILFFIIAIIVSLAVCCYKKSKFPYIAAILAFAAAFFTAAGMAFFHGAEYMERSVIKDDDYFFSNWHISLQQSTSRKYGYSYALGWVAMILIAIVAFMYAIAGYYLGKERYREAPEPTKQMRMREFVAQPPPMVVEPGYAAYDDPRYFYGYPGRGYAGPYMMDMEKSRGMIAADPHWSWS